VYLPVPSQPDCATAWLEAVKLVNACGGHEAHNVIIDIAHPMRATSLTHPIVKKVNDFLLAKEKSVECVANTIFPRALYQMYGAPAFIDVFHDRVLKKVRKNARWSGYYFERMTRMPAVEGEPINQLWDNIVLRIRDDNNRSLNKFELSLFDPERDVDGSPYGGQCLSFLSFKLLPGDPRTLILTAIYRNHYYVEKLLGNIMGLGRLMEFVAKETGTVIGPLTIHSTHAYVDTAHAKRSDVNQLIQDCDAASALVSKAA
jgi:thymidylate synthase